METFDRDVWATREAMCGVDSVSLEARLFCQDFFQELLIGRTLERLEIDCEQVSERVTGFVDPFSRALAKTSTKRLQLLRVKAWPEALLDALSVLLQKGVLKKLQLSWCKMDHGLLERLLCAKGLDWVKCHHTKGTALLELCRTQSIPFVIQVDLMDFLDSEAYASFCCPQVRTLRVEWSLQEAIPLIRANPQLEKLVIRGIYDGDHVAEVIRNLPNLRKLKLRLRNVEISLLFSAFRACRHLESLTLDRVACHAEEMIAFLNDCPQLKKLAFKRLELRPIAEWKKVFRALPEHLEALEFGFDDETAEDYFDGNYEVLIWLLKMPHLRKLIWIPHNVVPQRYTEGLLKEIEDLLKHNMTLRTFSADSFSHPNAMQQIGSTMLHWEHEETGEEEEDFFNHRNRCCVGLARQSVATLLALRKRRTSNTALHVIPRDVVGLIARHLWCNMQGQAHQLWPSCGSAKSVQKKMQFPMGMTVLMWLRWGFFGTLKFGAGIAINLFGLLILVGIVAIWKSIFGHG